MEESKTREKILKKIRQALIHKTENRFPKLDFDSPVHASKGESLEMLFAEEFKKVNGHFVFCEDELDFAESIVSLAQEMGIDAVFCNEPRIKKIFDDIGFPYKEKSEELVICTVSVTLCEQLVARTGTVFVSSAQSSGRRAPVFPDTHMVLAFTSQLVFDTKDALNEIRSRYGEQLPSLISAITGPSRTADIEKTLVQGAHGPKEIFVFLVDDSKP